MSFKRFNSSQGQDSSADSAILAAGTLVVNSSNQLQLHDGTTAGGNTVVVGGTIVNANGIEMTTARGTVQFGYNLEAPGVPQHFHINKVDQSFDLFFGDDSNYLHLPAGGTAPIIGANDGTSGQKLWTFGQDGSLTFPDNTRQTTAYAGPQIHQTTVTLTPSDLAGLNQYPGKTLVSGGGLASNQVIVVTALEFSLTYNTTPYTTTANLYLNYSGNYLTVPQAIPAGNTTANNNVGMLTASRNTYRYVQNGMVDGDFPPQQDVILMSDGAISNGDSNLNVRVTYIITTLF